MINNNHPITPPPELVEQWCDAIDNSSTSWKQKLATQAARWGADQELDECCDWMDDSFEHFNSDERSHWLRAVRRIKAPSLKEKASQIVDCLIEGDCLNDDDATTLRQVVESLPS